MKIKKTDIPLYGIFTLIFLWDILDEIYSNIQFIILFFLFALYLILNKSFVKCKKFAIVWTVVFIHGILNCLIGNDNLVLLLKQLVSIGACYIIFKSIIAKYSIEDLFKHYWRMAFCMSFVGILQQLIGVLNISFLAKSPIFYFTNYYYRVGLFVKISALCREPSFLAYLLAPGVCFILAYIITPELVFIKKINKKYCFQAICIILSYVFTFSAVAMFGVIVMSAILWYEKGICLNKIIFPILAIFLLVFVYKNVPEISVRIDSLINLFSNSQDGSSSNLSSYTYYLNYSVTKSTIINTYGVGSGLGGYQNMFDKYSIGAWENTTLELNREDANSGLFRIISELGIAGLFGIITFIIKFFPKKSRKTAFSLAMLTFIFMILLRQGNYVHAGSILFICMYIKGYYECRKGV